MFDYVQIIFVIKCWKYEFNNISLIPFSSKSQKSVLEKS